MSVRATVAGEPWIASALRLERAANVGPLLHLACYLAGFIVLVTPGIVVQAGWRALLWTLLLLLNYSLSIGVMHMHCHRPLFVHRLSNRVLEVLLCLPSLLTSTEMTVLHVHHHHHHNDGADDVTSTLGCERGVRAVGYWISYGWVVKSYTFREVFRHGARKSWQKRRTHLLTDLGICLSAVALLSALSPATAFYDWLLPALISHVTFGYFSWLTHAPARGEAGDGSINNVDNLLNFFIFNQGFHAIHHAHPGIHWTEIPDKLSLMNEVDDGHIVPYWVSINSAWRILVPERFRNARFGAAWRRRLDERMAVGQVRARRLRYFVWI